VTIRPRLNVICGRCRRRREGRRHVFRSNSRRRATIKLEPVLGGCARCGKQYGGRNGNPLTHVCRAPGRRLPQPQDRAPAQDRGSGPSQDPGGRTGQAAGQDHPGTRTRTAAIQGPDRTAQSPLRATPRRRESPGQPAVQEPAPAAAAAARLPVLRQQGLPAARVRRVQTGLPGRRPRRLQAGIRAGLRQGIPRRDRRLPAAPPVRSMR
jgi:hypothetical protein